MLKKSLHLLATGSLLALTGTVLAAPTIRTQLDGRPLDFDQPAVMREGRVMVPLRGIFESLGAEVLFDSATRTIKATRGDRMVELTLGSRQALINGTTAYLDVPASTLGGRTLVPLRFVSESLGNEVRWLPSSRTVALTSVPVADLLELPIAEEKLELINLVHNARATLHPGERLIVSVNGEPGGQASFDLMGIANNVPMSEISRGRYQGEMAIREGMSLEEGTLVVHLRRGDRETTLESRRPVSIAFGARPSESGFNTAPSPAQGSVINNRRPSLHAELENPIRASDSRVFLDGNDISAQSSVSGSSIHYNPNYDLKNGIHHVSIRAFDHMGRAMNRDWTFSIQDYNNTNSGESSTLYVTNLTNGSNVSSNFQVQGQTDPYAQVRIVAQARRDLISGVIGIGLQGRVANVQRKADAYGRFDIPIDLRRVTVNTPVVLEITSTDPSGRSLAPLRLDVVRR